MPKSFFLFIILSLTSIAYADTKVGELFLVDHFNSAPGRGAQNLYKNWIMNKSLGGMVFWNSNRDNYLKFQTMTNDYRAAARAVGKGTPILSIDHEGKGVQRLRSSQGFTNLATPSDLGRSIVKQNSYEVCSLHGEIMSKELSLAGINTSLGTIADTYNPNSGTRNMLRSRSISNNPRVVANCLKEIFSGIDDSNKDFLFITKHFPGLGVVNGNTDTGVRHSRARSQEEAVFNLFPFKEIIKFTERSFRNGLGLMASNAIYPLYDQTSPAPESKPILTDLLRKKLRFSGIIISDALWVGQYEGLSRTQFKIALSRMVLAGMDMLMIPASKFERNFVFFSNFYNGSVSSEISTSLMRSNGYNSERELVRAFRKSVDSAVRRIRKTKKKLGSRPVQEGLVPKDQTQALRRDYQNLL